MLGVSFYINNAKFNKVKESLINDIVTLHKKKIKDKILSTSYSLQNEVLTIKIKTPKKEYIFKEHLKEIKPIISQIRLNLIILYISLFFYLLIITLFINFLMDRFIKVQKIVKNIKNRNFNQLPPITEEKNICDEFRNELVSLGREIETYIDMLSLKMEDYKKQAYIDGLTNIFNRNFLKNIENNIFIKAKFSQLPTSIIMMDVDNFKYINDTYGHKKGDEVLAKIAKTLKENLRKHDILIRYGGEEFLVILSDTDLKTAKKIANKLLFDIENLFDEHKVTMSAGVSQIEKSDNNIYDSIKRADEKLYLAKKKGKNRVEV
jgi:diguanylate cyclase (GGDEF)-like protein